LFGPHLWCGRNLVTIRQSRSLLAGSPQQVLEDLQIFADYGYSHITVHLDCPSGTVAEWKEQLERWAAEIIAFSGQLEVRQMF